MNVLLTGANGFIGKALCVELSRQGYVVRAAMRELYPSVVADDSVKVGNIDGETDWSVALDKIDVVIHLAARVHMMQEDDEKSLEEYRKTNVLGTLNLAEKAAKNGVKRFIFLSSVKVNGERTALGMPFTEDDEPNPQDNYGLSKLEAEQGLSGVTDKTGMEVVIIRPPLVYGQGVKANFASMMKAIRRGIPLPLGGIHNKRSLVSIGNLVNFVEHCINHPAAANQVFLVSDGHDLSTPELLRACANALEVKAKLFPIPVCLLEFAAGLLGKQTMAQRLCESLQVDIDKAKQYLSWVPPMSVEEGLKSVVSSGHND